MKNFKAIYGSLVFFITLVANYSFAFAPPTDLLITTEVVNNAIVVCGSDATVNVKIKNTTQNAITLSGLNFLNPSFSGQITVSTPLPSGWKNTGCTGFTYCPTGAISLAAGQEITLTFKIKVDCSIIPAVEGGQQNFFNVTVGYNSGLIASQTSVGSFNVLYPNYSINVQPSGVVSFGQIVTRTITICNLGNGFNDTILLKYLHDPGLQWIGPTTYAIKLSDGTIVPTVFTANHDPSTGTYIISDNVPLNPADPNAQKRCYIVTEKYKVTACSGKINSDYTASWGCGGKTCTKTSQSLVLVVKDQFPQLSLSQYSFTTKLDFCQPGFITYEIKNVGADMAGNLKLDVPHSSNVKLTNGRISTTPGGCAGGTGVPDVSGAGSPYSVDLTNMISLANGTTLINLGGKLFAATGAALYVCFDVAYNCPAGGGQTAYDIGDATLNYTDGCDKPQPPVVLKLNEDIVSWATCGATYNPNMKVGDTTTLKICYDASTSQVPCSNPVYTVMYTLPPQFTYVPGTGTVGGVPHGNISVNGNIVTFNEIPSFQGLKCFEIKVKLTCNGTNPGDPNIQELLTGFTLQYQCDKNDPNCCKVNVGTQTFNIFGNFDGCPGIVPAEKCLQTTSFTVRRNTFGRIYGPNGPFADANTPGIALDRAYPCDELLVCSNAKWISGSGTPLAVTDAFIKVEFDQPANLLQFLSGTVTIFDNGGVFVASCALGQPVTTISGVRHTQMFSVPCGGSLLPGYEIRVCSQYKVLDDPAITAHGPIISVFRTTYGFMDNGVPKTCAGIGDQIILMRPDNIFTMEVSSTQPKPQCEPVKVKLTWHPETCFEDDFPNEFRPINQFVDYKFEYPTGYNLMEGTYTLNGCGGQIIDVLKSPLPDEVNCDHPFANLNFYTLVDKCSNSIEQVFEFSLQPTCLAPETGTVKIDVNYKNFPGSACEKPAAVSKSLPIINYQPKLTVTALPSNVNASTNKACWTLRVFNGSFDIPAIQAFLKFPACSGITVTSIHEITNGSNIDLTASLSGGTLPIGTVNGAQERLFQVCGTYQCTNNACPVEVSWTCGETYYCTNPYSTPVCSSSQTIISVTPKEGLLQTQFIAPQNVDVCKDVTLCYIITNSGEGSLYDVQAKITTLPACWTLVPGSVCVTKPANSVLNACSASFNLMTGIPIGELSGSSNPSNNSVKVCFTVKTDCALLNCTAANIVVQTTAKKGCGDIVTNNFVSNNLVFTSTPDYSYTPSVTAEDFTYCTSNDVAGNIFNPAKNGLSRLVFSLKVNGPTPNTNGDQIQIAFPDGFRYVAGSLSAGVVGLGSPSVTGTSCPGSTVLNLQINTSTSVNQIINFSVNIQRCNPFALPCGTYPFSYSITQKNTRTCSSTGMTCVIGTGKVTNYNTFNINVRKPSYSVTAVTEPVPLCATGGGSIMVTLANSGGLSLGIADLIPVQVYCVTLPPGASCPTANCGGPLPNGATLVGSTSVIPGMQALIGISSCAGTHLFIKVGGACSATTCFCPTSYCYEIKRPSVDFTVNDICAGSKLCVTNTSNNAGISPVNYSWLIKNITTGVTYAVPFSSSLNPNTECKTPVQLGITLTPGTTYAVTLTQYSICGTKTITRTFTVHPLPVLSTLPSRQRCANDPCYAPDITNDFFSKVTVGTPFASGSAYGIQITGPGYNYTCAGGTTCGTPPNICQAGTYAVTITDKNGCSTTRQFNFTVNPSPTVSINDYVTCAGEDCLDISYSDLLTHMSGGTPSSTGNPYDIVITDPSGNGIFFCSKGNSPCGAAVSLCDAGTYKIVITDTKGCTATDLFNLTKSSPAVHVPDFTQCQVQCFELNLSNLITGGTPFPPIGTGPGYYAYTLIDPNGVVLNCTTDPNGPNASACFDPLCTPGKYTLTVTDANGCIALDTFYIKPCCVPISGNADFSQQQNSGVIHVGGVLNWTKATLYIKTSDAICNSDVTDNDFVVPFTPADVDGSGNIHLATLVPAYKKLCGYTRTLIYFENECSSRWASICSFECCTLVGKLDPASTVTQTFGTFVISPTEITCSANPVLIDWTLNNNPHPITMTITEIYDPALGFNSPKVPGTSQVYNFPGGYTTVPDLRTLPGYVLQLNRWYEIDMSSPTPLACGEGGTNLLHLFFKFKDCATCTAAFTTDIIGVPIGIILNAPLSNPQTFSLTSNTTGGATPYTSYQWDFTYSSVNHGVGTLSTPTLPFTDLTVSTNNRAHDLSYVSLIVTDSKGCRATSSKEVKYTERATLRLANQTLKDSASLSMFTNLFPNPSNGTMQLNYFMEDGQQGEFIITDMLGKALATYKLTPGESILNISQTNLSDGVYFYQVMVNGEVVKTNKFSVVH